MSPIPLWRDLGCGSSRVACAHRKQGETKPQTRAASSALTGKRKCCVSLNRSEIMKQALPVAASLPFQTAPSLYYILLPFARKTRSAEASGKGRLLHDSSPSSHQ